jgi:hypothetical protein
MLQQKGRTTQKKKRMKTKSNVRNLQVFPPLEKKEKTLDPRVPIVPSNYSMS